jgi:hypothetical protein
MLFEFIILAGFGAIIIAFSFAPLSMAIFSLYLNQLNKKELTTYFRYPDSLRQKIYLFHYQLVFFVKE